MISSTGRGGEYTQQQFVIISHKPSNLDNIPHRARGGAYTATICNHTTHTQPNLDNIPPWNETQNFSFFVLQFCAKNNNLRCCETQFSRNSATRVFRNSAIS